MAVRFDEERMERALENHLRWWRGELDRPLICVTLTDAHPSEKKSPAPVLGQESCADLRWSAEQMIDALDEALSQQEYLGDAFPMVNFAAFGPGVLAAFCGAKLDNRTGRVWFFPPEEREIGDIHVKYDPENVYVRRIKDLYRAGRERWGDAVVMGMPDLGGVMDVAATFRGSQNLLLDLYDEPDEVKRLVGEIETAWYAAYDDLAQAMGGQKAHSDWSGLLCDEPAYIPQCDFCYMIGEPMFREFVLDTLRRDAKRLSRTIYHLDGVGELNHLDDILAIGELDAVQWVHGDGKPPAIHWLDVYRRILDAGKGIWICDGPRDYLDALAVLHGTPYSNHSLSVRDRALADALLTAR